MLALWEPWILETFMSRLHPSFASLFPDESLPRILSFLSLKQKPSNHRFKSQWSCLYQHSFGFVSASLLDFPEHTDSVHSDSQQSELRNCDSGQTIRNAEHCSDPTLHIYMHQYMLLLLLLPIYSWQSVVSVSSGTEHSSNVSSYLIIGLELPSQFIYSVNTAHYSCPGPSQIVTWLAKQFHYLWHNKIE